MKQSRQNTCPTRSPSGWSGHFDALAPLAPLIGNCPPASRSRPLLAPHDGPDARGRRPAQLLPGGGCRGRAHAAWRRRVGYERRAVRCRPAGVTEPRARVRVVDTSRCRLWWLDGCWRFHIRLPAGTERLSVWCWLGNARRKGRRRRGRVFLDRGGHRRETSATVRADARVMVEAAVHGCPQLTAR